MYNEIHDISTKDISSRFACILGYIDRYITLHCRNAANVKLFDRDCDKGNLYVTQYSAVNFIVYAIRMQNFP